MDCGNPKRTCGGMTSSGPGDSDWFSCDLHAADFPFFGKIYAAQIDAMFSHREVPNTREECVAYYDAHLVKHENADGVRVGNGVVQIHGVS